MTFDCEHKRQIIAALAIPTISSPIEISYFPVALLLKLFQNIIHAHHGFEIKLLLDIC